MGSVGITQTSTSSDQQLKDSLPQSQHVKPLRTKGLLDQYESFDTTPTIGREYPTIDLKQLLQAPNADELIRDLAITSEFLAMNPKSILTVPQFRSEESSFSGNKMTSTMTSKKYSYRN